jgi:serine O-acetyltransferase
MKEVNIEDVIDSLCSPESYSTVFHDRKHEMPMPSIEVLVEIVESLRKILFPGYYAHSDVRPKHMRYYMGANIDKIHRLLTEQIKRGFCFECGEEENMTIWQCNQKATKLAAVFISRLPHIRHMLSTDAVAAYNGDPAAKSLGETIFCYPSINALTNYRIAHELYKLGAALIARIISELAHSQTGIDIHPGAEIGESFFIDHGTGVVIGETCIIGKRLKIYQGVTLGAKSFTLDESGNPIKGIPRHPIIEDNVTIYAGATLLGRITIGENSVIGGNVWLTQDVPPHSLILSTGIIKRSFENGAGI